MRPPLEEYAARQRDREAAAYARERTHIQLGNAKVAIFIAAVIYTGYALTRDPSAIVYGIGAAAFIALSIWHEVVMRALARAQAAVTYYADGIARIEDRWMRDTPSGERFRDRNHPYADDLDVFGSGSLFQLLSSCRTPMGEDRLARWLLHASPIPEIRERQARVAALRSRIDLRERIAVVNAGRRRSMHAGRLIAWAEEPASMPPIRIVIVALALAFAASFTWYVKGGPGIYVAIGSVINVLVLSWLFKRADAIAERLSSATESAALGLFANVIKEIELESFDDPALTGLARRFTADVAASRGLARLARIADWADSRHNVFLKLSEIPLLFTPQLAYAAESWRRLHGRRLRDWVDAIGEMEALLSLSGYSYEHPAYPFAELIEGGGPRFDAAEVSHPLLPASAVSNSLQLTQDLETSGPQILLVSGSNMSGKSTLMRTVGMNALMALAGAPVRAERLRLTPLQIGTCLRHTDSLQEHRSGFYTEALRIRSICDLLDGPLPVLFLFDELLSGTNSKDRRVAAEGVARTMLERGAIGMVTTHDLALTEIAAIFPGRVTNVHLQDKVEHGQMTFDYKLRDGVITHSNALELMRMIGLDV
ncbi:MAG: mismatch repair protein [Cyanobacteria bacterium]|nr:mismatch repair protein [Cyanobacteriota bacterium]